MSTTARAQKAPDTRGPVRKLLTSFGFQILAALVLGIAVGLIAVQFGASDTNPTVLSDTLGTIGSSYVTLLRTAVVPLVFAAIKEITRETAHLPVQQAFDMVTKRKLKSVDILYSSDDQKEGARAFAEKRKPVWRGR